MASSSCSIRASYKVRITRFLWFVHSHESLENDTLARIGTSCLQQLLEKNASKLSVEKWERVIRSLIQLFKLTTPHQLYDEKLRMEIDEPEAVDHGESASLVNPVLEA